MATVLRGRSDCAMSGNPVLLDSVILIDHFNGHQAATDYLHQVAGRAFVSVITRAEVLVGFDDPDAELARHFAPVARPPGD